MFYILHHNISSGGSSRLLTIRCLEIFFIWVAPFHFLFSILFPFVLWGRRVAFICLLSMDGLLDLWVWSIV